MRLGHLIGLIFFLCLAVSCSQVEEVALIAPSFEEALTLAEEIEGLVVVTFHTPN